MLPSTAHTSTLQQPEHYPKPQGKRSDKKKLTTFSNNRLTSNQHQPHPPSHKRRYRYTHTQPSPPPPPWKSADYLPTPSPPIIILPAPPPPIYPYGPSPFPYLPWTPTPFILPIYIHLPAAYTNQPTYSTPVAHLPHHANTIFPLYTYTHSNTSLTNS